MGRARSSFVPLGAAAAIVVVAVLFAMQFSGDGGGPRRAPGPAGEVARSGSQPDGSASVLEVDTTLRVSPATVLLTAPGQTRRLRATLPNGSDASGVTWHSDAPDRISVAPDGTVEAQVALGSAVIRAIAGERQSPPVLVYVAQPVDGAILVDDDQVEGDPVEAADVPPGAYRYVVRLRGVDPPPEGVVVLATGDAPVGGRVVAARRSGGATEITLEVVPPEAMFERIEIEKVIDLTFANVEVPQRVLDGYDVHMLPDGTYQFDPKEGVARPASGQQLISQVKNEFDLGPFECETQHSALPISLSQPVGFNVNPNVSIDLLVRDRFERLVLSGRPRAGVTVAVKANVGFTGKVECKLEAFKIRVPIGGALAYLFGLRVPVGIGVELEGKVTLAELGLDLAGEVGADFRLGVQCPDPAASCSMVNSLNLVVDGSVRWNWPDPDEQFRVEPSVFGFFFLGGELGSDLLSAIEFEALELKGGLAQDAKLAPVSVQVADAAFASSYELKLKGEAEAAQGIDEWLAMLGMRTLKLKAEISETLHRSPTGSATADVDEFKAGETVIFEVALEGNLFYPLVGYNVDAVTVFRRDGDRVERVAVVTPEEGADRVTLRWTADRDGSIGQDFYAFALTKLLPLPDLEIGPVAAAGASAERSPTPDPDAPAPLYACEPLINTLYEGFWPTDLYHENQCERQLMDCTAGAVQRSASGQVIATGYSCVYNTDRKNAYIDACGNTPEKQIARGCIAPR